METQASLDLMNQVKRMFSDLASLVLKGWAGEVGAAASEGTDSSLLRHLEGATWLVC